MSGLTTPLFGLGPAGAITWNTASIRHQVRAVLRKEDIVIAVSGGEFNKAGKIAIEWTRIQLSQKNRRWLMELPLSTTQDDVTFVHASPGDPGKWH